jgi:dihydrofolate reductase
MQGANMRISLMMVMSLDGRITQGDVPGTATWTSPEDQALLKTQVAAHDCLVMGRATYEVARAHIRTDANKPRIIMTRSPETFAAETVPGLIFSDGSPQQIIELAEAQGGQKILLLGGATTNALFLDQDLIDELYVTIEPVILGSGLPLTKPLLEPHALTLINSQQLNERGTILLHYRVNKQEGLTP